MSNTSNQFLLLKYQLNEQYHDSKEKSGWISMTLYYTFSIGVFSLILDHRYKNEELLLYSFMYLVITGLSLVFISKQFYRKAETVILISCYKVLFKNASKVEKDNLLKEQLIDKNNIKLYNMEIPLYVIAIILYSSSQYLILDRLNCLNSNIFNSFYLIGIIVSILFLVSLISICLAINIQEVQQVFKEENSEYMN